VGFRGEARAGGLGTESPEAGTFSEKYTTRNLRPCENEKHNLMPLMLFFIAVHTGLAVIFGMC